MSRIRLTFSLLTASLIALLTGCQAAGTNGAAPDEPKADAAVRWSTNSTFNPAMLTKVVVVVQDKAKRRSNNDGVVSSIEDEFMSALTEKGYDIPSRSDLKALIGEQQFQQLSGMTEAGAAELGRQLNAKAILIVSITQNSTEMKEEYDFDPLGKGGIFQKKQVRYAHAGLGARLIEVETAKVLCLAKAQRSAKVSGEDDATQALSDAAQAIAAGFPARREVAASATLK